MCHFVKKSHLQKQIQTPLKIEIREHVVGCVDGPVHGDRAVRARPRPLRRHRAQLQRFSAWYVMQYV